MPAEPSLVPADPVAAGRPRHDGMSTLALLVAVAAAFVPLLTVIAPGLWIPLGLGGAAILLAAGYLVRRLGSPAVGVFAIEALLWVAGLTLVFFADAAVAFVIPTQEAVERLPYLVASAAESIAQGVAPLDPTAPISFFVVAATGLLVIALDHVVLTARMPLLAGVGLLAVWLIPTLAVPRDVDLWAFALMGAALLWLIRAETRGRTPRSTSRGARVAVVSASIAVVAIVASVVVAPAVPRAAPAGGLVGGTAITASLDLGDDLRRPNEVPVVRTWTDAPSPPYLRVATLTRLDGETWRPDRGRLLPLATWDGAAPETAEDVEVAEYRTGVQVLDLVSASLPIPYPAVAVSGLEGDGWSITPENRTIRSSGGGVAGQRLEVTTSVPRPSREQAQASRASTDGVRFASALELPFQMPENIESLAGEVTAGADNDYDRLLALQTWFRGTSFDYSLDAPVEEGFDGSGAEAIGRFLEMRSGYCVHFASAFALMARTLDMPSRVVVGFLPGAPTGETEDDERVYQATTAQLHAWPEVRFEGIGWVAFEPTKSLGTAQRFAADSSGEGGATPTPTAAPSDAPTATPTAAPREDEGGPTTTATGFSLTALGPPVGIALAVIGVSVLPLILRRARTAALRRRADRGDVRAAWRMVQDAAIDLGEPLPAAESPRAFAARLVAELGAPEEETTRLRAAVEHHSYARPGRAGDDTGTLGQDAEAVCSALRAAAPTRVRALALFAPRSLAIAPGSAFAERDALLRPAR
ncbi:transglutaminaseTgpA domain-containing protein [Microbacterium sp.]|uniref:transglutaminase family protein n=1 Tax=Microbacterium sp. TaxID=51671 RepID=UPI0037362787